VLGAENGGVGAPKDGEEVGAKGAAGGLFGKDGSG